MEIKSSDDFFKQYNDPFTCGACKQEINKENDEKGVKTKLNGYYTAILEPCNHQICVGCSAFLRADLRKMLAIKLIQNIPCPVEGCTKKVSSIIESRGIAYFYGPDGLITWDELFPPKPSRFLSAVQKGKMFLY